MNPCRDCKVFEEEQVGSGHCDKCPVLKNLKQEVGENG